MPHALDIVFSDFRSDVERVESLLILTKIFRDFGASNAPTLRVGADSIDPSVKSAEGWKEALDLHAKSKNYRTDLPILSGSLLLYLTGRFEYCIRQIVEAAADEIAGKTPKFQNLPPHVQKILKQRTLEIAQNPKRYGYDDLSSEILLESLVINIRGNGNPFSIKSEVLSITEANMRPAILQELLKAIGLTEFWRDIGKQASVKIALQKSLDQEAAAEAQIKLNELMEERNQIAHPTSTTTFPDADKVLKVAEFLKILASNTVDLAKVYLTAYKPAVEKSEPK